MIRILIVDDSAIVRRILSTELARFPDIEVVGTAPDAFIARDKIVRLNPDVITLDIEMPGMDGISLLKQIMKHRPVPVIIVSSLTQAGSERALEALAAGAFDVIAKPDSSFSVETLPELLARRIRAAAGGGAFRPRAKTASVAPAIAHAAFPDHAVLAIGASTGGTEAIREVVSALPATTPPVLIVQHMPSGFTAAYARRLNDSSALEVREARDGDRLRAGQALLAPGGHHMLLRRNGGGYRVELSDAAPVHFQRPSVDVLFHSVARVAGSSGVGVLLTGMGVDGAQGLLAMRSAGAATIAQDESTCVVFGMPREAIRIGAAMQTTPLPAIPAVALKELSRTNGSITAARVPAHGGEAVQ